MSEVSQVGTTVTPESIPHSRQHGARNLKHRLSDSASVAFSLRSGAFIS